MYTLEMFYSTKYFHRENKGIFISSCCKIIMDCKFTWTYRQTNKALQKYFHPFSKNKLIRTYKAKSPKRSAKGFNLKKDDRALHLQKLLACLSPVWQSVFVSIYTLLAFELFQLIRLRTSQYWHTAWTRLPLSYATVPLTVQYVSNIISFGYYTKSAKYS